MNLKEMFYRSKHYNLIQHAKYNVEGQGMVKMMLLPSKMSFKQKSDIIILNKRIVIPIAPAWSILLSCFINELKYLNGEVVSEEMKNKCVTAAINKAASIYFGVRKKET